MKKMDVAGEVFGWASPAHMTVYALVKNKVKLHSIGSSSRLY